MSRSARPKRIKLREGDVFEFEMPDGRLGYGIIIKRGELKNGGTPYIAMFGSAYDARPELNDLIEDDVVLAGWTMDALVYHGRWRVFANCVPLPTIPFPNFKVGHSGTVCVTDVEGQYIGEATARERELLDYQWSRSPIGFQTAFEAIHGFTVWNPENEKMTPDYARQRMTRPSIDR